MLLLQDYKTNTHGMTTQHNDIIDGNSAHDIAHHHYTSQQTVRTYRTVQQTVSICVIQPEHDFRAKEMRDKRTHSAQVLSLIVRSKVKCRPQA